MRTNKMPPLIAVVDDEAAVREATESVLRSAGLRAETFASAMAFLESDCARRARCLVLDVRLPGMSGLDLQKALGERASRIPIVFITAQDDAGGLLHAQALRAGALDFLHKPFHDEHLLDAIHRALAVRAG